MGQSLLDQIKASIVEGAFEYRIHDEKGSLVATGSLAPFKLPPTDLPPGKYLVRYFSNGGVELTQFQCDSGPGISLAARAEDAAVSIDFDVEARQELDRKKTSSYYRATIDHYMDQLMVLGARAKGEVKVKELQQEVYEKLIENNLRMLEAINSRITKISTPPEPPQWDKIVGAGAPAFAALGIEIVRALTGVQTAAPKPLLPPASESSSDERTARMYAIVGDLTSSERITELLQDKEKFAQWRESVREFIKDDPRRKSEKPSEKAKSE